MLYRQERIKFRDRINRNRNETWGSKWTEVECHIGRTKSSETWKLIKSLGKKTTNKVNILPIQIDQWQRYYAKELTEDREKYLINSPRSYTIQRRHIEIDETMIKKAVKSMKNNRAPGPAGRTTCGITEEWNTRMK